MGRQERWILVLGLSGLAVMGAAMVAGARVLVAPGSVLVGVAGAWSMIQCQRKGEIRTNRGIYRKAECRVCYFLQLGWWWTATVLWTIGGVAFAFGFISHK